MLFHLHFPVVNSACTHWNLPGELPSALSLPSRQDRNHLIFSHTFWSLPPDRRAPGDPKQHFEDTHARFWAGHISRWTRHLLGCCCSLWLWKSHSSLPMCPIIWRWSSTAAREIKHRLTSSARNLRRCILFSPPGNCWRIYSGNFKTDPGNSKSPGYSIPWLYRVNHGPSSFGCLSQLRCTGSSPS